MSDKPVTIQKNPALKAAEDYYGLRSEGINLIIKMCSDLWSDYNTHDPGVTIHEALCYAITDLAYRAGWDIKDILTVKNGLSENSGFYPGQVFFTARDILTVNPVTPTDFRRLLIDLDDVRNAWLLCREGLGLITDQACCDEGAAASAVKPPEDWLKQARGAKPLGLYDVLLELEADLESGDLNDYRIEQTFMVEGLPLIMEFRFPKCILAGDVEWDAFLEAVCSGDASFTVELDSLGFTKSARHGLDDEGLDTLIRKNWRNLFYLDFTVSYGASDFDINNVTMRVFGDAETREVMTAENLQSLLGGTGGNVIIQQYAKKEKKRELAVLAAKKALHQHRNLDEDFHSIGVVPTQDVAVCADVELRPDADIELVYAQILLEIEQYFNPPIPFYSLQELLDEGKPVEELFNGPELENGFIRREDLDAAVLKPVLYVSDIINRLMEIDGVVKVGSVQMTSYDPEGNMIAGMADPVINSNGETIFDPAGISASWMMYVSKGHQPRLYYNASDFLFYKNGLPFRARMDEVRDTLTKLRGEAERPRFKGAGNDMPVPEGRYRNIGEYYPVQYSFPKTYCMGQDEMPQDASDVHRAQVMQLKAYLMVFEQILGNAFEQVAHSAELFSIDPAADRTYFIKKFSETLIQGYNNICMLTSEAEIEAELNKLAESGAEYLERRNRFLDHLLARFGESFREYSLLLSDIEGRLVALDDLVEDKRAFLAAYPEVSHDRGKAFNYKYDPCLPANQPGIKKRVNLLLGSVSGYEESMIVVEHLLLRPKFPGDALYPQSGGDDSSACCYDDPYSFRLTFVMPGWVEPYKTKIEVRNFAERTIRQEVASHLHAKICWVGNDGLEENAGTGVTTELCMLLEKSGRRAGGGQPSAGDICECAKGIFSACITAFSDWYEGRELDYADPDMLDAVLDAMFDSVLDQADTCGIVLTDSLQSMVLKLLYAYFHNAALYGMQFERFEKAWTNWLNEESRIDWMEERLQEQVKTLLADSLMPGAVADQSRDDKLEKCSSVILRNWGWCFHDWMERRIKEGMTFSGDKAFTDGQPYNGVRNDMLQFKVYLCDVYNDKVETVNSIKNLLIDHYTGYMGVSYSLRVVLNLLVRLRNIYPAATLHDWDEGNDQNPVRLGKTALGS